MDPIDNFAYTEKDSFNESSLLNMYQDLIVNLDENDLNEKEDELMIRQLVNKLPDIMTL